jgi:hypothetical protein
LGAIAAILEDSIPRSVVKLDHRTVLRNFKQVIGRPHIFITLSVSLDKQLNSILNVRQKLYSSILGFSRQKKRVIIYYFKQMRNCIKITVKARTPKMNIDISSMVRQIMRKTVTGF